MVKGRSLAGIVAGLLLAGAAGAVLGNRRKRAHVVLPSAKGEEKKAVDDETVEHAALREILEKSVAYNEALFERVSALEKITDAESRPAAVEALTAANQEKRKEIEALRVALQAHLNEKNLRFCDIDGFVPLISAFRLRTLEQQEKHLTVYHKVRQIPRVPDSPELHAYLKLGFSDLQQKQADTAAQIQQAMEEQRDIMLRVGRMLAGIKDSSTAQSVPSELLSISTRYQRISKQIRLYKNDDPEGAKVPLEALKSMYAALTPPLKEQASQLRQADYYGNALLRDLLQRLLPEK